MAKRNRKIPLPTASADPQPEPAAVSRIPTSDILASALPLLDWVVPDCLANELTLLVGNRNAGKTWLALDIAVAVATGGKALGKIGCETDDVLYMDLENGPRHMQRRLAGWYPDPSAMPDLARLSWTNDAPDLSAESIVAALDDWWMAEAAPRLVVIDGALQPRAWRAPGRAGNDGDVAAMRRLRAWSNARGVGVLFLCRTRGSGDPLETSNEASGVLAVADATLRLDRRGSTATLHLEGRSAPDRHWALEFAAAAWTVVGEAGEIQYSQERRNIREVLASSWVPLAPSDIAGSTGLPVANVKKFLFRMLRAHEVDKSGRGLYLLPKKL